MVQLVPVSGAAHFGSCLSSTTHVLWSHLATSVSLQDKGRAAFLASTQVWFFPLNPHQLSKQEHECPGDLTFSSSLAGRQNFK